MTNNNKDKALSRWEDEGGAMPCGPQEALAADCDEWDIPPLRCRNHPAAHSRDRSGKHPAKSAVQGR